MTLSFRNKTVRDTRSPSATKRRALALVVVMAAAPGCSLLNKIKPGPHDTKDSYHEIQAMRIEYPEVQQCETEVSQSAQQTTTPLTLEDPSKIPAYEMSLSEAVNMAVQKSPVIRSIGGTIVSAPATAASIYDPALAHANPQLGTEAALAAFDAQYTQQLYWSKTDQPNNVDQGGFTSAFTPTASVATGATFINELSKQTASGASFALRHNVIYNRSNQPFRAFQSDFVGWVEAEWRQPLMQGSGNDLQPNRWTDDGSWTIQRCIDCTRERRHRAGGLREFDHHAGR